MARLVSATDFLSRGTFTSSAANIAAAESIMDGATSMLQSILGTDLSRRVVKDYYPHNRAMQQRGFRVYTSRGFIDMSEDVEVYKASTNWYVDSEADGTQIDPEWYTVVKPDQGHVEINFIPPISRMSFFVKYTAGFDETDDVYVDTPQWLREGCMALGFNMWYAQSATTGRDGKAPQANVPLNSQARSIIDPHIRQIMGTRSAVKSIEEALP